MSVAPAHAFDVDEIPTPAALRGAEPETIAAEDVVQRFDDAVALDGVSIAVPAGSVHALLGPNGAGKTTLLRILAGLLVPTAGHVRVGGLEAGGSRAFRAQIGLVPSGDRSFYLRISGVENLAFFARLHGLSRRDAVRRSLVLLHEVGLEDAARRPVGLYSHGMQKRLSVARALLTSPRILLVDEATHDLDPEGAVRVRELVVARARAGTAVVWATQRLDEIRGLADRVTLLSSGRCVFAGSVPELLAYSSPRRYLLRVGGNRGMRAFASTVLSGLATVQRTGSDADDVASYLLELATDVVLGDALAALHASGVDVLTCTEERSGIEQAFLALAASR